jgi:hypothetical protein
MKVLLNKAWGRVKAGQELFYIEQENEPESNGCPLSALQRTSCRIFGSLMNFVFKMHHFILSTRQPHIINLETVT